MVDIPSHESWASEKPSPGQDLVNHSLPSISLEGTEHLPELGITPTTASFKSCHKYMQIANKKSELICPRASTQPTFRGHAAHGSTQFHAILPTQGRIKSSNMRLARKNWWNRRMLLWNQNLPHPRNWEADLYGAGKTTWCKDDLRWSKNGLGTGKMNKNDTCLFLQRLRSSWLKIQIKDTCEDFTRPFLCRRVSLNKELKTNCPVVSTVCLNLLAGWFVAMI